MSTGPAGNEGKSAPASAAAAVWATRRPLPQPAPPPGVSRCCETASADARPRCADLLSPRDRNDVALHPIGPTAAGGLGHPGFRRTGRSAARPLRVSVRSATDGASHARGNRADPGAVRREVVAARAHRAGREPRALHRPAPEGVHLKGDIPPFLFAARRGASTLGPCLAGPGPPRAASCTTCSTAGTGGCGSSRPRATSPYSSRSCATGAAAFPGCGCSGTA
jgi:hypothetical protein